MNFKEDYKKQLDLIKNQLGLTQEQIAKRLGYSRSYLSELIGKRGNVDDYHLNDLKREFNELLVNTTNEPSVAYKSSKNRIPFYDAEASAGITETDMSPIHAPAGTIDVGDLLHDSKAAIRIYGNSMTPNYPPGCVVGLLPMTNSFIEPGEVYVVETRDRRMLKRIFYKDDNPDSDYLMCYSDNLMKFEGGPRDGKIAYPPFYLHKQNDIIRMYIVTGVIKRNANSVVIHN
jgi:transcriptional regulator with XRE-family HTH domain